MRNIYFTGGGLAERLGRWACNPEVPGSSLPLCPLEFVSQ